jgi:ASC-1-like (ASCH) protein
MDYKKVILRFRAANRDIFEAILSGRKKIETRAASSKFKNIKAGDTVILVCGKERTEKKVIKAERFRSIGEILNKYKPEEINPKIHTAKEACEMWNSFPGYKEKIKKSGLIAITLK